MFQFLLHKIPLATQIFAGSSRSERLSIYLYYISILGWVSLNSYNKIHATVHALWKYMEISLSFSLRFMYTKRLRFQNDFAFYSFFLEYGIAELNNRFGCQYLFLFLYMKTNI